MWSKNGSGCTNNGGNNANEPSMRPSVPRGNIRPWNRRIGWWLGLERHWEEALHKQRQVQDDYERFCQHQPATLSAAEREQIRVLARDLPPLWHADTTTPADRQRIVRLLIERVVVDVRGTSQQVSVTIYWAGGSCTNYALVRPVQSYEQLADYAQLRTRIKPCAVKVGRWLKWPDV